MIRVRALAGMCVCVRACERLRVREFGRACVRT